MEELRRKLGRHDVPREVWAVQGRSRRKDGREEGKGYLALRNKVESEKTHKRYTGD